MSEHMHAVALADWIEGEGGGTDEDGLHLGPTDLGLVAKALRALAATLMVATPPPDAPEAA